MLLRTCIAVAGVGGALAAPRSPGQSLGPAVFVCNNVSDEVTSFLVNPDGSVALADVFPVAEAPQTIALSADGAHLLVAHATDDDPTAVLEVLAVGDDATLTLVLATTIPDSPLGSLWVNDTVAAITQTDLGAANFVNTWTFDPRTPSWALADSGATGSFSTALALHPDGDVLYAQDSTNNTVTWFGVGAAGDLTPGGSINTGTTFPLRLAVTHGGQFLYAAGGISNGGDKVLGFSIGAGGGLSPLGGSPFTSPGASPAYLAVSSDDAYLFVGHGTDATVRTFSIDGRAGTLAPTGAFFDVGLQGTLGDLAVIGDLLFVTDESTAIDGIAGLYSFRIEGDGSLSMIGSINDTMGVRPEALAVWPAPRPADIDGDGVVGTSDLLALLAAWGPCPGPCPPSCAGDIDGDCTVGTADLLLLLAAWG